MAFHATQLRIVSVTAHVCFCEGFRTRRTISHGAGSENLYMSGRGRIAALVSGRSIIPRVSHFLATFHFSFRADDPGLRLTIIRRASTIGMT
jgi:hypothetical protein